MWTFPKRYGNECELGCLCDMVRILSSLRDSMWVRRYSPGCNPGLFSFVPSGLDSLPAQLCAPFGSERGHVPSAAPARQRVPVRTRVSVSLCAIRCDGYGLTQRHQATKEDHSARAAFVLGSHRGLPLHDPCPRSRGLNPPPAASRPPPPAGDTQARTRQSHVRRTCFLPAGDTQARTRQSCVRCSCPPLSEVNRHWLIRGGAVSRVWLQQCCARPF